MDSMASALGTMRKYGMNIISVTQFMDADSYVKTDPRMPRTRLRRYLGQYGLRGEALNRDIVAGPERRDNTVKDGIYCTWPYGWEPADFTPMMRRIFKGKQTCHLMMFDEVSLMYQNTEGR